MQKMILTDEQIEEMLKEEEEQMEKQIQEYLKKYPKLSKGEIAAVMMSLSPIGLTTEESLQRMYKRK